MANSDRLPVASCVVFGGRACGGRDVPDDVSMSVCGVSLSGGPVAPVLSEYATVGPS